MSLALLVERIERRAMVDRQIAGFAMAMGAKTDLPDPDDILVRFNDWLSSPLENATLRTPEQRALRRVLLGHE